MRLLLRSLCCASIVLLSIGAGSFVRAQRSVEYHASSTVQGAPAGSTPFWHHANTRGRLRPGSAVNGLLGAGVALPFRHDGGLDVSVGAKVVGRLSDARNTLHLLRLYGKAQYRGFRLSVGRFPETIGLNGGPLSMGSMVVSRNAPPVPKIKLFTPDFLDVPFTAGHLQVRGRWSDGQLGANRAVERPLLHQKSFYLKVNVADVSAIGGFVQNTIWDGTEQSREFQDYLNAFVGSQKGTENDPNRVGNSVAAYDFALRYPFDDWRLQASRLFYLEDTVSLRFRSPWDGIWGLRLRRTSGEGWIDDVLYQHMNTIQQDALPGAPPGRADYYTHFLYESGWTYQGAVLGNPLIVFNDEQDRAVNNMIIAHHLGVNGTATERLRYAVRLTYSRNYGVCADQIIRGTCRITSTRPAPPNQEVRPRGELREDRYSILAEVRYRPSDVPGLQLVGSVAADAGAFRGGHWGLAVGVRWSGSTPLD